MVSVIWRWLRSYGQNFTKFWLSHKNVADCAVLLVIYCIIYVWVESILQYSHTKTGWITNILERSEIIWWSWQLRCKADVSNRLEMSLHTVHWQLCDDMTFHSCHFTQWHISSGHSVDLHQSICPNICSQNNGHCNDHLGTYLQPCSESLVIRYSFANDVSNRDLQVTHPWVTSHLCRQLHNI